MEFVIFITKGLTGLSCLVIFVFEQYEETELRRI